MASLLRLCHRLRRWSRLLVCLLLLPADAAAWDDLGHRIVCEIAFGEVRDNTRERIAALLRPDPEFVHFRDACTWPDHPRSRPDEHYVNLSRPSIGLAGGDCPSPGKCLLAAIAADRSLLASPAASPSERLAVLKYLGHWIGDVHQPFHVSFPDDRGGNDIIATGSCAGSLHDVWDDCLVAISLGQDVVGAATELRAGITGAQRAEWAASEPATWAGESFAVVTRPEVQYCVPTSSGCWYDSGNGTFEPGEAVRTVLIDQAYVDGAGPIIRDRLKRAGVRLAYLLEQALLP